VRIGGGVSLEWMTRLRLFGRVLDSLRIGLPAVTSRLSNLASAGSSPIHVCLEAAQTKDGKLAAVPPRATPRDVALLKGSSLVRRQGQLCANLHADLRS
jgi:hypothetical protein